MFHKTRIKLSLLYATLFFLFFSLFLIILYVSLVNLMSSQQLDELESLYIQQKHDFYVYGGQEKSRLSYEPNQNYFYYIYTKNQEFIHGDESHKGLKRQLEKYFVESEVTEDSVLRYEWQEQYFLLLKKPIYEQGEAAGYIILGKSITSQQHFFQKSIQLFIFLTCISTVFIGLLSYYMARKAMIPIQWSFDKQRKFVSDASHELRTPLSIFYSSLDILETGEASNLSPFGKELVDDMKDEAQLMKELLEKLLFLARHDQQQGYQNTEVIQLSNMLERIGHKFQKVMPAEIHFTTDIQENIEFLGDATNIQELLYILLDNAILYATKGSITLTLSKESRFIKITVSDNGVGIPEQELTLIFERFYRSDQARQSKGNGLGLSLAKAIVQQHDGEIYATSIVGEGTTFHILFPI
ncbi:HAMP domain-containing sensor histidine kinase [Solibacillus sp. FSL R7-0668]|uniref:sensor histidine kinase n=1 Tax=Solibacillus sp. FSL R7-0668 TaxID=2921688 RepID=UPI0030FB0881